MKASRTSQQFTLAELADRVGGSVDGDGEVTIDAVAPIESAGPDDLSFVANQKYTKFIATTKAAALVLDPTTPCADRPAIRHPNPYLAFAQIIDILHPLKRVVEPGVDATAVVNPEAAIDPTVGVGPLCHIEAGSRIGAGSQLVSSVYVGRDVIIGSGCLFYPGVRIMHGCRIGNSVILHAGAVIGSDGFGYAKGERGLHKIQQIGWVEIGDEVEIGANTAVDRGTIGPTRIGHGTKIDNLVQIAHNVEIGQFSIIVGQVGISGSTKLGNGVVLGGQVGMVGHIEVGDGVQVAAQSGLSKSVPAGKSMFGTPARELPQMMRIEAALGRLPELLKRVSRLEKKPNPDSAD